MNPLIINYDNGESVTCSVFMYLSSIGLGVLKVAIPLIDTTAERFKKKPMEKWFKDAEIYISSNKQIRIEEEENSILEITDLLRYMVQNTFEGFLLSGNKNLCFESFLLLETVNPNMNKLNNDIETLKQVYHFAFPDNFLENPTKEKIEMFKKENFVDIGGFQFLKCTTCRLIIYGDIKKLKKYYHRDDTIDDLKYFEASMQISYDWVLCVAMWKRINQMTFVDVSSTNLMEFNQNKATYNFIENELDVMIDSSHSTTRNFYKLVYNNMEEAMSSSKDRLERLSQIEHIIRDIYFERRNLIIEAIALVITMVFGLPAIRETIQIIRTVIWSKSEEMSMHVSVDNVSIILWLTLMGLVGLSLYRNYKKYQSYKKIK